MQVKGKLGKIERLKNLELKKIWTLWIIPENPRNFRREMNDIFFVKKLEIVKNMWYNKK